MLPQPAADRADPRALCEDPERLIRPLRLDNIARADEQAGIANHLKAERGGGAFGSHHAAPATPGEGQLAGRVELEYEGAQGRR